MDNLTDSFSAIYIHGTTTTNNWQDCVYYWKAPQVSSDWKLGTSEYWAFHENRYDDEYTDPITET